MVSKLQIRSRPRHQLPEEDLRTKTQNKTNKSNPQTPNILMLDCFLGGCSERVEEDEDDDCFEFVWRYGEHTFEVPYQMHGEGVRKILFLPTIHIASSYKELIPLTRFFGDFYTTFVPDWPGFGNSSRLNCTYCPLMYLQFIRDFIKEVMNEESISVIACGHSCGYVLSLAKSYPEMWNRICIISPTYKVNTSSTFFLLFFWLLVLFLSLMLFLLWLCLLCFDVLLFVGSSEGIGLAFDFFFIV